MPVSAIVGSFKKSKEPENCIELLDLQRKASVQVSEVTLSKSLATSVLELSKTFRLEGMMRMTNHMRQRESNQPVTLGRCSTFLSPSFVSHARRDGTSEPLHHFGDCLRTAARWITMAPYCLRTISKLHSTMHFCQLESHQSPQFASHYMLAHTLSST